MGYINSDCEKNYHDTATLGKCQIVIWSYCGLCIFYLVIPFKLVIIALKHTYRSFPPRESFPNEAIPYRVLPWEV